MGPLELICHTELKMKNNTNKGRTALTVGVVYEVIEETPSAYYIIDDLEMEHRFSKYPDSEGKSYANWLNVLQDEEE